MISLELDPDKIVAASKRGVEIALRNLGKRWDDEYLSEGLLVAWSIAIPAFRQYRSSRDVYAFISFVVTRKIKTMIFKEGNRRRHCVTVPNEHLVTLCNDDTSIPETGDEELIARLKSGEPLTRPSHVSRKVWEVRRARQERLARQYGNLE